MTHTNIDKGYRREKLNERECRSLKQELSVVSFSNKFNWISLAVWVVFVLTLALLFPYIPPRFGWGNWEPAKTNVEYQRRFIHFLSLGLILIAYFIGSYIFTNVRNRIDLNRGFKLTAKFQIHQVLNVGFIKFLLLGRQRFFLIKSRKHILTRHRRTEQSLLNGLVLSDF